MEERNKMDHKNEERKVLNQRKRNQTKPEIIKTSSSNVVLVPWILKFFFFLYDRIWGKKRAVVRLLFRRQNLGVQTQRCKEKHKSAERDG